MNPWDRDRDHEVDWEAAKAVQRARDHAASEVGAPEVAAAPQGVDQLLPGDAVLYRGISVGRAADGYLHLFRRGALLARTLGEATAQALVDHELDQRPGAEDPADDFASLAELCAKRGWDADAVGNMVLVTDHVWRMVASDRYRFMRLVRASAVG